MSDLALSFLSGLVGEAVSRFQNKTTVETDKENKDDYKDDGQMRLIPDDNMIKDYFSHETKDPDYKKRTTIRNTTYNDVQPDQFNYGYFSENLKPNLNPILTKDVPQMLDDLTLSNPASFADRYKGIVGVDLQTQQINQTGNIKYDIPPNPLDFNYGKEIPVTIVFDALDTENSIPTLHRTTFR